MRFLATDENSEAIDLLLSGSSTLKCAVAYIGQGAHVRFGIDRNDSSRAIQILCDLNSGCCNPDALLDMLEYRNITLRSIDCLHAKVYWSPERAEVGSANLSTNGLGLQGLEAARLIEAGCEVRDTATLQEIERWFDDHFKSASDVTQEAIERSRKVWDRRQAALRRMRASSGSVLKAALKDEAAFANVFLVFTWTDRSDAGNEATKDAQLELGLGVESYEDWDDLPHGSQLIAIACSDSRGSDASFDGTWHSQSRPLLRQVKGGYGHLFIIFANHSFRKLKNGSFRSHAIETPDGNGSTLLWTLTPDDKALLIDHAGKIIEKVNPGDDGGCYYPLTEACKVLKRKIQKLR